MVTKRRTRREPAVELIRRRFTIDEYDLMIKAGILDEDERVELLGGEIICMAPIGIRHWASVNRLNDLFGASVRETAIVSIQSSFLLPPDSEPEPDVTIVRRRDDYYVGRLPGPDDVLLIIEVADSSLAHDRANKIPRYAAGGIRESWLVDLPGERVIVHRDPVDGQYKDVKTFRRGATITPLAFPELTLRVDDILGPAVTDTEAGPA